MPIIAVTHASPLTPEQVEELVATLTDAYVSVAQAKAETVHVLVDRVDPQHWGVGGRTLARRNA
ncbi:tautomerase family protein [Pseudonocardia abyssalis]|jgi:4-oxalocrotonate tautomerase|uniref:Tautomerase family protein n=1 Tax=Pseudonocardia abyssalis TaxID=2792008 RepID=A0ABS6URJ2_9PSEU|nr:tautomerase family protein [Pseudonocardia abyssalis]MBW0113762.1 tautomerase family protein [Pseudonocardia abyssalis]MBW0134835.1 tautomerase family protein [Pseudonocardia abyssalis]